MGWASCFLKKKHIDKECKNRYIYIKHIGIVGNRMDEVYNEDFDKR